MAAQQFQVMQDSVKLIQDTMGVYAAFLGQGSTGQSGVAISKPGGAGATTLSGSTTTTGWAASKWGSWHWHTCWKTWPASATTR